MDISAAIKAGRFVEAAYAGGENATATTYDPPAGYEVIAAIYANDLSTDIAPIKDFVSFGFIAQSVDAGTDYYVALRGTETIWEWVQDFRFLKVQCPILPGAGSTEDGFTALYQSLSTVPASNGPHVVDVLRNLLANKVGATLTLCGHSLGSAVITLLAFDIVANKAFDPPTVYTFASPYVGDALFASTYDQIVRNTWRIANQVDIITHLPPSILFGYEHVLQLDQINSARVAKLDPSCCHDMATYLHMLSLQVQGEAIPIDPSCAL